MRSAVLSVLLFCTLSGLILVWGGPWGPSEERLHLAHALLGAASVIPACWFLARHIADAAGRRLHPAILVLLLVVQVIYLLYFDFHPLLVYGKFVLGYAVLHWGLGRARALAFAAGSIALPLLLDSLSRWWPDLRFQWEAIQLVAPLWWAAGLFGVWMRRPAEGPDRLARDLPPRLRAVAWAAGGAFLFLLGTGLILLAGGGLYREGRIALVSHRAVGLLSVPVVLYHVARAWMAGRGLPGIGRRTALPLLAAVIAVGAVLGTGARTQWPPVDGRRDLGPSAVSTVSGHPYASWTAADGREGCGGAACHEAITLQWEQSAHHLSARSPVFSAALEVARAERGAAAVRLCAGCHAPAVALTGGEPAKRAPGDPLWGLGVSCAACHNLREDPAGTLVIGLDPALPMEQDQKGRQPFVLGPVEHSRRYMHQDVRDPDLCAPCHQQRLPGEIDPAHAGLVLHDQVTSWREGPFGPEGSDPRSCADCHMARSVANPFDFAVRDHRMGGMNWWLADRFGAPGQGDHVRDHLLGRSRVAVPEFDVAMGRNRHPSWPQAGAREGLRRWRLAVQDRHLGFAALQERFRAEDRDASGIDGAPGYGIGGYGSSGGRPRHGVSGSASRPSGPAFTMLLEGVVEGGVGRGRAVVGAPGVGHHFPNGPQDLVETAWTIDALDASGAVIAQARRALGAVPVDAAGLPIREHRIWTVAEEREAGRIPPGGTLEWRWTLRVPDGATVSRLRCRLEHRPLRPEVLAWAERRPTADAESELPFLVLAEAVVGVE